MFNFNPVPKPSHSRVNPTQRVLGYISGQTRKEVKERSGGVCERCYSQRGVQMAHLIRRTQLNERTTSKILAHLCVPCHKWVDESGSPGRIWAKDFLDKLGG